MKGITTRISSLTRGRLRVIAKKQGLKPTTLINSILVQLTDASVQKPEQPGANNVVSFTLPDLSHMSEQEFLLAAEEPAKREDS